MACYRRSTLLRVFSVLSVHREVTREGKVLLSLFYLKIRDGTFRFPWTVPVAYLKGKGNQPGETDRLTRK